MARVAIESQAAPAAQGPLENQLQEAVVALMGAACTVAALNPGVLVGAAIVCAWRWLHRPPLWVRLACAGLLLVPLLLLDSFVVVAWPWRDLLAQTYPGKIAGVDAPIALRSLYTEALAGPLWFETMLLATRLRGRRVDAQIRRDHNLDKRRWRAISGRRQPLALPDPHTPRHERSPGHPVGKIRLGVDSETGRYFDLDLPADLSLHAFLPGVSGTGKTTTLTRLADGAVANGYGVVFVDAKAAGLGSAARTLAERYGLPFYLVDPDDPASLGYNPCSGDAAAVANKIVGAFSYGPSAEIYKNIAMELIPAAVRGLQAAGQPVTLDALYDAFTPRGLVRIAHQIAEGDPVRERLMELGGTEDRIGAGGNAGLRHRLGALREGKFGDLFRADHFLDWDTALMAPSVTYIALSALASSEDVELMGRVVAQDLKQACARRLRALDGGTQLTPVVAIFDEFAALSEAEQLVDLLLQARQAQMPVVISTQYVPETLSLRNACIGAGLLIAHRVGTTDAEVIAGQLGTRRSTEVTHQVDYETGYSEKGSMRRVDKFNVHPNELRTFRLGQAVVNSTTKRQYTIIQVLPDNG